MPPSVGGSWHGIKYEVTNIIFLWNEESKYYGRKTNDKTQTLMGLILIQTDDTNLHVSHNKSNTDALIKSMSSIQCGKVYIPLLMVDFTKYFNCWLI